MREIIKLSWTAFIIKIRLQADGPNTESQFSEYEWVESSSHKTCSMAHRIRSYCMNSDGLSSAEKGLIPPFNGSAGSW